MKRPPERMTVGKHEGQLLSEIPGGYLRWFAENASDDLWRHKEKVKRELQRRQEMSEKNNINEALMKAQAAFEAIHFNKSNPHFKSKYASLDAILNATRKALAENGLTITQLPDVLESGQMVLRTQLRHVGGDRIEAVYPIAPEKSTPQAYGSALTYARRYSLAALLNVCAEEDEDGNAASEPDQKPARGNFRNPAEFNGPVGVSDLANAITKAAKEKGVSNTEITALADGKTLTQLIQDKDMETLNHVYAAILQWRKTA